ncbi:hypothetical protein J1C56_19935 [Aminobacter anthyllidis]|uniref:Uncharacterized protein n=1 Tax=Aminobacter anthyllidis TaxID=1035067 RepID=A0A9X1ADG4_9HYPH|nr:hypothetical protein [Aminobacter anthyllidis]MBT1157870.1 hypothetical protein [Aminobacter anthyllidis]
MRKHVLALALAMPLHQAAAEEISSVYVETKTETDCVIFDKAGTDDGDYANMVCPGYRGYPVLVFSADLRESVFYGFPPADFVDIPWQSFETFNRSAGKAEWRISSHDGKVIPFATIRRWYVQADVEGKDKEIEVLVVTKVGQPGKADGCVVALVMATGEPKANELARKIADEQVRDFACGSDERVVVGEPMPVFYSEGKTKN